MIRKYFMSALAVLWLGLGSGVNAQQQDYPSVTPGRTFAFPVDHGAHPDFRTEWWYVTGMLETSEHEQIGFQVTFFRTRPAFIQNTKGAFAPTQIIFAHVALSDPKIGKLVHDQRAARIGFGVADAKTDDVDVNLKDWVLKSDGANKFRATIVASDFSLNLQFVQTQPLLLEGEAGYRKRTADPADASYYYSIPQMQVTGSITRGAGEKIVSGKAWLDHEWYSSYLDSDAVGWDWTGLNFNDGSALMAFRMRGADGAAVWAGGTFRRPDGTTVALGPKQVSFQQNKTWTSPLTEATYPTNQTVKIELPEGPREFALTPLFPDQELDGRAGRLPVYWEGAVTTTGGSGYLELTGYVDPIKL